MCARWIHMALVWTQQMTIDRWLEWDEEKNAEKAKNKNETMHEKEQE